ncbi:Acid phosphatase type 7 [Apodemus speciosus]|uniref:Acid phosphatase type 7 n=1 Tax=Apodemus speciosus TaxID=105296 RepID=A0ABQ0EY38_APOSI
MSRCHGGWFFLCLLLLFSVEVQGTPEYPRAIPEQVHLSYLG